MNKQIKKILCVEDDSFFLNLLSVLLQNTPGVIVLGAHNGVDGILVAKTEIPDVVILDLMLPDVRGSEVLQQIKALDGMHNTPIIILSNLGDREEVERCLALGAHAYFVKSNTLPSEIVEKVADILGIQSIGSIPGDAKAT